METRDKPRKGPRRERVMEKRRIIWQGVFLSGSRKKNLTTTEKKKDSKDLS